MRNDCSDGYTLSESKQVLGQAEKSDSIYWKLKIGYSVISSIGKDSSNPGVNDKVIKLLNQTEEYQTDSLYIACENLLNNRENWENGINYYEFLKTIQEKLENRNLSNGDYNEIYNDKNNGVNQEVLFRYSNLQKKYKKIGFDNLSIGDLLGTYSNTKFVSISCHFPDEAVNLFRGDKSIIESIRFMEEQFSKLEELNNTFNKLIVGSNNQFFLGLYLKNSNFLSVITGLDDLGEYTNGVNYSYINGEHNLYIGASGNSIVRGKTLEKMIDNFNNLDFLFSEKDKFGDKELTDIISKYIDLKYFMNFWLGENNAISGFSKPSNGYGLRLYNTFGKIEIEASSRAIMKLMADNGNKWQIERELIPEITYNNLKDYIIEEDGIIKINKKFIKIVEDSYNKEKDKAIKTIDDLLEYFESSGINTLL